MMMWDIDSNKWNVFFTFNIWRIEVKTSIVYRERIIDKEIRTCFHMTTSEKRKRKIYHSWSADCISKQLDQRFCSWQSREKIQDFQLKTRLSLTKINFLQWCEREKVMLIFFSKIWMSRGNLSRSHSSMRYRQLNRPSWEEYIVFIRRKCNMYLRLYNVNWVFQSWLFDIGFRVFFLSLYGSKSDQYTCLVYIYNTSTYELLLMCTGYDIHTSSSNRICRG